MIEFIGGLGSLLFALCAYPQAKMSIRQGHSKGISNQFLTMWLLGELLTTYYVIMKIGIDVPLLFNYGMNFVFLIIIIRFKIWPREEIDVD